LKKRLHRAAENEEVSRSDTSVLKDLLEPLPDSTRAEFLVELYETGYDVDLEGALNVLKNPSDLDEVLAALRTSTPTECRTRLLEHFSDSFLSQPPEQKGGVISTIENYLKFLLTPDIAEVFCRSNSFEFSDIERGKIICVSMPQKYQAARRWVNTFMKLLFYTHVLRRFDQPPSAQLACGCIGSFFLGCSIALKRMSRER
jgi:hypothetical protein